MKSIDDECEAVFRFVENAKNEMEKALHRARHDTDKIMLTRVVSELHDVMWFLAKTRLT